MAQGAGLAGSPAGRSLAGDQTARSSWEIQCSNELRTWPLSHAELVQLLVGESPSQLRRLQFLSFCPVLERCQPQLGVTQGRTGSCGVSLWLSKPHT